MQETVDEYKERVLGYVGNRDPIRIQASTPLKIARLLKNVPQKKLTRRPAPNKWSVAEIIAHLADGEIVGGYRIRMILGTPGTELQGFDQDKWAESGRYSKRDPKESLELFRALRKANLALFRSLNPDQWKLHGIHAERGAETLKTYATMFAGHDINHLRQIEAIVGKSNRKGE
jgi:hypothetical protein